VFTNPAPAVVSSGQFELASWGARFGAMLIDHLLRLAIAVAITVIGFVLIADHPFSVAEGWEGWNESQPPPVDAIGGSNGIWLVLAAIGVYYLSALIYAPAFMTAWRGATPGKRMVGIRVIREDGRDLGFGGSFLREPIIKGLVINIIGGTFVLIPLVNYLWPLWDRECRAGHDFMARTRVIKTRSESPTGLR